MINAIRNFFARARFRAIIGAYRFHDAFDDPAFYALKADLRKAFPGAPIEIAEGRIRVFNGAQTLEG
jgi:hypothetical protein